MFSDRDSIDAYFNHIPLICGGHEIHLADIFRHDIMGFHLARAIDRAFLIDPREEPATKESIPTIKVFRLDELSRAELQ